MKSDIQDVAEEFYNQAHDLGNEIIRFFELILEEIEETQLLIQRESDLNQTTHNLQRQVARLVLTPHLDREGFDITLQLEKDLEAQQEIGALRRKNYHQQALIQDEFRLGLQDLCLAQRRSELRIEDLLSYRSSDRSSDLSSEAKLAEERIHFQKFQSDLEILMSKYDETMTISKKNLLKETAPLKAKIHFSQEEIPRVITQLKDRCRNQKKAAAQNQTPPPLPARSELISAVAAPHIKALFDPPKHKEFLDAPALPPPSDLSTQIAPDWPLTNSPGKNLDLYEETKSIGELLINPADPTLSGF